MSLSTVLFLFLAHLGVGIACTLAFVDRDAGVKFFRFNGGLAALLLIFALAFRLQEVASVAAFMAGENSGGVGAISIGIGVIRASDLALIVSAAITLFYWATIGRVFTRARTLILSLAAIAGLIAVGIQGVEVAAA